MLPYRCITYKDKRVHIDLLFVCGSHYYINTQRRPPTPGGLNRLGGTSEPVYKSLAVAGRPAGRLCAEIFIGYGVGVGGVGGLRARVTTARHVVSIRHGQLRIRRPDRVVARRP